MPSGMIAHQSLFKDVLPYDQLAIVVERMAVEALQLRPPGNAAAALPASPPKP